MSYIGNLPSTQAFTPAIDYFSGNGSTTAFTLSRPVASVAQVQVVIDNVAQNPSTAFTISSNTITFTSAPLSGTNNIYVYYTSPITQIVAPSDGSVTASVLAANAVTASAIASDAVTASAIASDAVTTAKILNASVTPAKLSQPLTSGTAVASTSGTSINFTSLPSWVKRITVLFQGLSTNGTSNQLIQLGTGSTTYTTSGYVGVGGNMQNGGTTGVQSFTTGFGIYTGVASYTINGSLVIKNITGNTWVADGVMGTTTGGLGAAPTILPSNGYVALGAALTAVRVTTVNGTDTFDAGTINIMYEG